MPEIDSEALLRRDFFFSVNKRRAEEKILELNNQLIQGLNRALNQLHRPNQLPVGILDPRMHLFFARTKEMAKRVLTKLTV